MPIAAAIPFIISGLNALAGGLGNRSQSSTSTGSSTQNNRSQTIYDILDMPEYDQPTLSFRDILMKNILKDINQTPTEEDIRFQSLGNINQGSDALRRAMESIYASRGLAYSPSAATGLGGQEANRIAQIIQAFGQAPFQAQQYKQQAYQPALSLFGMIPKGQSRTGTSLTEGNSTINSTQTQTGSGNVLGGAIGGGAATLAALYGKGAFGGGGYVPPKNLNVNPYFTGEAWE